MTHSNAKKEARRAGHASLTQNPLKNSTATVADDFWTVNHPLDLLKYIAALAAIFTPAVMFILGV